MPLPVTNYVPQTARPEGASRRVALAWLAAAVASSSAVGLLLLAPALAAGGYGWAATFVYRVFAGLCHQQAERSFTFAGHALAVCARCTGMYAGFAACVVLYPLARPLGRPAATPARAWLALALLPTAVDFLLNAAGLWSNTHLSRAATGVVAGAGAAFFALPGLLELGQSFGRPARSSSSNLLAPGRRAGGLST